MDEAALAAFCRRQAEFNRRKGLGRPLNVEKLVQLREHLDLFSATIGTEWLVDALILRDGQRARYWVGINNSDYRPASRVGYASRLALWTAICHAKEVGSSHFDFGGVILDPSDQRFGITRFKQGFGGYLVREEDALVVRGSLLRWAHRAGTFLRARLPGSA